MLSKCDNSRVIWNDGNKSDIKLKLKLKYMKIYEIIVAFPV